MRHRKRSSEATEPLPCKAMLLEFRGDWSYLREAIGVPAWNTKAGICWACSANPESYRDTTEFAEWRLQRTDHFAFLKRMREQKKMISAIWETPSFRTSNLRLDWLHTVDQGVAKTFGGSVIARVVEVLKGTRCGSWTMVLDVIPISSNVVRL